MKFVLVLLSLALFFGCTQKSNFEKPIQKTIDTWDFSQIPDIKTIKTTKQTQSYSSPLSNNQKATIFTTNTYLQGFINSNNKYFIVLASSKNDKKFSPLKPSVWILLSDLD